MTITSTLSRVVYAGNGATTVFPFSFEVPADGDLTVVRGDADGTEAILVLGTDYSVAGAGAPGGGSITYPLSGSPLPAGKTLTLARIVGLTQETDLTNQGAFYAEVHEDAFDKLTMIDQQQQDGLDRSLRFPISDAPSLSAELPPKAERAGKVAAYGSDGAPTVSAITLAAVESYGDVIATAVTAATAEAEASVTAAAASAAAADASADAAAVSQAGASVSASAALASQGTAATSEANAATSAAAAATLASALWRGMTRITAADSPYAVAAGDNGKLIVCDTSAGAVTVNLPQISGLTLPYNVGVQLDAGSNTITINRAGTDTIDGATAKTLTTGGAGAELLATAAPDPDEWEVIDFGFSPVTGGDGIDVTGATVSVDLAAVDPGLEFAAGKLQAKTATETAKGAVEKSTSGENVGGVASDVFPDVAGVKEMITTHAGTSPFHRETHSADTDLATCASGGTVVGSSFSMTITADDILDVEMSQGRVDETGGVNPASVAFGLKVGATSYFASMNRNGAVTYVPNALTPAASRQPPASMSSGAAVQFRPTTTQYSASCVSFSMSRHLA